jgi:hypothetical protein
MPHTYRLLDGLHAAEREQLLAVADALLFGDPDSEQALARALDLIARLRESDQLVGAELH